MFHTCQLEKERNLNRPVTIAGNHLLCYMILQCKRKPYTCACLVH
uniref:Uncharacterized protein n=1 Tax=Arundo donax TaxID=35708 RepID=A0A0A9E801_ARUDO